MAQRKQTNSNEYMPATRQEIEDSAKRLAYLRTSNASCGNCSHRDQEKFSHFCTLKDRKRVEKYNICIHHRKERI